MPCGEPIEMLHSRCGEKPRQHEEAEKDGQQMSCRVPMTMAQQNLKWRENKEEEITTTCGRVQSTLAWCDALVAMLEGRQKKANWLVSPVSPELNKQLPTVSLTCFLYKGNSFVHYYFWSWHFNQHPHGMGDLQSAYRKPQLNRNDLKPLYLSPTTGKVLRKSLIYITLIQQLATTGISLSAISLVILYLIFKKNISCFFYFCSHLLKVMFL